MDIERIKGRVKEQLSPERYEHTLRVTDTAIQLAQKYDVNEEAVTLAALLHDYAKDMDDEQLRSYIKQFNLPDELLDYDRELWHGPVGAEIAKHEFKITNEAIYDAIYYHTTGRAGMGLVELTIFVADYIEPARSFPAVHDVREEAVESLSMAARSALKNTIIFLLGKDVTIHPHTFLAYNDLTKDIGVK